MYLSGMLFLEYLCHLKYNLKYCQYCQCVPWLQASLSSWLLLVGSEM